ncbi:MAG TPA: hypothetical protein VFN36_06060 [Solirubrobacteraceae bacterium]|nr:hypothetical protein [Solirubrobacteraceae bacterium]
MTRLIRHLCAGALVLALAVPCAADAARAPRGVLTVTEFRQLSAEQSRFRELQHRRRLTWSDLYALCGAVGRSTFLLQRIHANCESGVGLDRALSGFFGDLQRCAAISTPPSATGTTTTGSTTSPTGTVTTGTSTGTGTLMPPTGGASAPLSASELKLFACLEPEYAVIGRAVRATYGAQSTLRSQVLARGFSGHCRRTLAPSRAQLAALHRFVGSSRRLALDVALITRMADGTAPRGTLNGTQLERDSVAFTAAGRAFERLHRPQTLTACPHR